MDALRTLIAKILSDYWLPIHPKVRKAFVFCLVGLIAVCIGVTSLSNQPSTVPNSASSFDSNSSLKDAGSSRGLSNASFLVHIVGAVVHPGVYELASGSRVKDAVFAADGFAPKADQASVNLARELIDGEQIVVLNLGQTVGASSASNVKVNPNRATAAELENLPGIGPALAARIVDYRLANGSFRSIQDLRKVAGIGPKLVERIKDSLVF